jgi:hypothetical protein
MSEANAEGSTSERVFKVGNRPLILIAVMVALTAMVPVSSLYELWTTGTIDLDAVSPTRQKIPVWILYATAWPIFLLVLWSIRPVLGYFVDREMFRLGPQGIVIGGETLLPENVTGFRISFFRGHVLRSTRGEFPVHPWMVKGGVEALAELLPHIPPLKKGQAPDWMLD